MKQQATLLRTQGFVPWSTCKLKAGRIGVVEEATNLPDSKGKYWFTPSNMTEIEESHVRNYGFLVYKNEFYRKLQTNEILNN